MELLRALLASSPSVVAFVLAASSERPHITDSTYYYLIRQVCNSRVRRYGYRLFDTVTRIPKKYDVGDRSDGYGSENLFFGILSRLFSMTDSQMRFRERSPVARISHISMRKLLLESYRSGVRTESTILHIRSMVLSYIYLLTII